MSSENQNIENLFRDAFEHFESDVSPDVWNKVQSQLPAKSIPSSDGGATSSTASSVVSGVSSGFVKVAAVVGMAGSLTVGGYWMFSGNDSPQHNSQLETVYTEPVREETAELPENTVQLQAREIEDQSPEVNNESAIKENTTVPNEEADSLSPSLTTNTPAVSPQSVAPVVTHNVTAAQPVENDSKKPETQKITQQSESTPLETVTTPDNRDDVKEHRPIASIIASVRKGKLPLLVRFSNQDTSAEDFSWDFGDGEMDISANPYHTFDQSGTYTVTLKVRKDDWISRDTMQIIVTPEVTMMIPNILTPNGDGINDAFRVEAENLSAFKCTILDRNGNQVYEMNNINSLWDGRDKFGNAVSVGSYLYIINYTTNDGYSDVKKGMLMLNR